MKCRQQKVLEGNLKIHYIYYTGTQRNLCYLFYIPVAKIVLTELSLSSQNECWHKMCRLDLTVRIIKHRAHHSFAECELSVFRVVSYMYNVTEFKRREVRRRKNYRSSEVRWMKSAAARSKSYSRLNDCVVQNCKVLDCKVLDSQKKITLTSFQGFYLNANFSFSNWF